MWELDYKESWAPKNRCFWTVMLEKTLESPLDCKEIQPVHPKWNQSWIFIGRTAAEAETPILWPPDAKNWLTGKDPDAREDWRQEEKGMTGDEMVGWHHWLDEYEFEQAPGVGDGQGSLACCSPWSHKEWDTTEQLKWTEQSLQHRIIRRGKWVYPFKVSLSKEALKCQFSPLEERRGGLEQLLKGLNVYHWYDNLCRRHLFMCSAETVLWPLHVLGHSALTSHLFVWVSPPTTRW